MLAIQQLWMKFCSFGLLDAVNRPGAAEIFEVFRLGRVPIARFEYWFAVLKKLLLHFVELRDYVVAVWYSQRAARAEVILNIDHDQGALTLSRHLFVGYPPELPFHTQLRPNHEHNFGLLTSHEGGCQPVFRLFLGHKDLTRPPARQYRARNS